MLCGDEGVEEHQNKALAKDCGWPEATPIGKWGDERVNGTTYESRRAELTTKPSCQRQRVASQNSDGDKKTLLPTRVAMNTARDEQPVAQAAEINAEEQGECRFEQRGVTEGKHRVDCLGDLALPSHTRSTTDLRIHELDSCQCASPSQHEQRNTEGEKSLLYGSEAWYETQTTTRTATEIQIQTHDTGEKGKEPLELGVGIGDS
mmetsp:Transcript_71487/g.168449  ORF Transcript_71487/g.168449 Transcript_71487/m.168449 type:complete len:205 (+) Transcript_71487:680-1294(+)